LPYNVEKGILGDWDTLIRKCRFYVLKHFRPAITSTSKRS
jgi:hypothetical protein